MKSDLPAVVARFLGVDSLNRGYRFGRRPHTEESRHGYEEISPQA